MKRVLFILLFCPLLSFSQVKVLGDIDFINNDYKLFFLYQRGDDTTYRVSDSIKHFVIYEKQKLLELQNTWIGSNDDSGEILECGYDYEIYITHNDSIEGHLYVNIWCGQVVSLGIGNGCDFKGNPFENLVPDKSTYACYVGEDTITKARILYNKIISTKNLYFPEKKYNNWLNFDGRAYISFRAKNKDLKKHLEIRKDFDEKYGKSDQYIKFWGFTKGECSGWLYCNKDFYDDLIEEKFLWDDFNVFVRENDWETWAEVNEKFSGLIFTDDIRIMRELGFDYW